MPILGEITLFAGNFVPVGWAPCDGRLLPIASNTALFSVVGTAYGGDGRTSFALPDLRGRVAVHGAPGASGGSDTLGTVEVAAGTGASAAVAGASNLQPYLAMQYIIATTGTYPSRA